MSRFGAVLIEDEPQPGFGGIPAPEQSLRAPDTAAENKEVDDIVALSYRQNIQPDVVNNNFGLTKALDEKEAKARQRLRQLSFRVRGAGVDVPELQERLGAVREETLAQLAPGPEGFKPERAVVEIAKGPVRFGENVIGHLGGTTLDWLGQFVQEGAHLLDRWSKLGSKNPDQIYNPFANAIIDAGESLELEGKRFRQHWVDKMQNGWARLDPELQKRDPVSYVAGQLSEGVASAATSVAVFFLSGGTSGIGQAGLLIDRGVKVSRGLLVLSGISAAGGFEHAQSEGENFLWSTVHGIADGGIEYAFESSVLDDVIKGARPVVIGAGEALEEFFTGMFQNMRQFTLENHNKGMTAYEAAKDAAKRSLVQAPLEVTAGFLGGYGIAKGFSLTQLSRMRPTVEQKAGAVAPTKAEPTITPEEEAAAPAGVQEPTQVAVEKAIPSEEVAKKPVPEEITGEVPGEPAEPIGGGVDTLSAARNAIRISNKARRTQVLPKRREVLSQRVGAASGTLKTLRNKGVPAQEAIWRSMGKLKGQQAPIAVFKPLSEILEPNVIEGVEADIADNPKLSFLERIRLTNAEKTGAWDKLKTGQVLTPADVRLIKKWDADLGASAAERVPWPVRLFRGIEEIMSLWKIGAGYDVQMRRQARLIRGSHPLIYTQAVGKNLKAYISDSYAQTLTNDVADNPNHPDAVAHGVRFLTESDNIEQFAPRVIERLPVLGTAYKSAIRGFVRAFNWTQQSLWDAGIARWEDQGITVTGDMMRDLAEVNNTLLAMAPAKTDFGQALRRVLSPVMWSPTFTWSRIKTPSMLIQNPAMRREIAKTLASFIGSGVMMLMAANMIGRLRGEDDVVEWDPRSTDFGKIKIKNTRFDVYGDAGPYVRAMMQLMAGEKKGQGGRIRRKLRIDVIKQFMRNKRAPIFDFLGRIWSGKTFFGGPAFQTPKALEDTTAGKGAFLIGAEIYQAFMPFFIRAGVEASVEDGWPLGIMALSEEFLSGQSLTYLPTAYAKMQIRQDTAATMTYGKTWDNLSESQQDRLRRLDKEIEKLEKAAADQRAQWGPVEEISLREQNEAAENVRVSLSKRVKKVLRDTGTRVTGLDRKAGTLWLNDRRYETYQMFTAEEIEKEIEKVVSRPSWKKKRPEIKTEIIKEIITFGKETARDRVLIDVEKGNL